MCADSGGDVERAAKCKGSAWLADVEDVERAAGLKSTLPRSPVRTWQVAKMVVEAEEL